MISVENEWSHCEVSSEYSCYLKSSFDVCMNHSCTRSTTKVCENMFSTLIKYKVHLFDTSVFVVKYSSSV